MGEGNKPIVVCFDGTPIGKVQELSFSAPCNPVELPLSSLTMTIHIKQEKMSRKRIVKLLMGVWGLSRNRAMDIAQTARVCCSSYWEFYYFRLFFLGREP